MIICHQVIGHLLEVFCTLIKLVNGTMKRSLVHQTYQLLLDYLPIDPIHQMVEEPVNNDFFGPMVLRICNFHSLGSSYDAHDISPRKKAAVRTLQLCDNCCARLAHNVNCLIPFLLSVQLCEHETYLFASTLSIIMVVFSSSYSF